MSYFILKVESHLSCCMSLSDRHLFAPFAVIAEFFWVCCFVLFCLILRLEAQLVILSRAPLWSCGPIWPSAGGCAGTSTFLSLCQGGRRHRKSPLLSRGPLQLTPDCAALWMEPAVF